jgi:signal transduction histidine kinase
MAQAKRAHTNERPQGEQSVRRQVLSLLWRAILITLVATVAGVFYSVRLTEHQAWKDFQAEAARNAVRTVATFVQGVQDSLTVVGLLTPDHLASDPQLMEDLLRQNSALLEMVRLDEDGRLVASATAGDVLLVNAFTTPQSTWFSSAASGDLYLGNLQVSPAGNSYLIMAVPARGGGAVGARLRMNVLWDVVAAIHRDPAAQVYVVSDIGRIVAHTDPGVVFAETSLADQPELASLTASGDLSWSGAYVNFQGTPVVGTLATVPGTAWVVITEIPQSNAFAQSQRSAVLLGGGVAFLGLSAVGITGSMLERRLLQPLERLRRGATRLGQGDLGHHIDIAGRDEIGQVAAAFNDMATRLRRREAQLAERTQALATEVAERKLAQEALAQKAQELSSSNAELQQFAYVASHDLQEPLRMVSSYLALLKRRYEGQLDADADDFIEYAVDGANRMRQLINDLLTYSRIGTQAKPLEQTDADALLQDALINLQVSITESGATVTSDPLPRVMADGTRMTMVFQNLVSNAIKFRREESLRVHISASPNGQEWVFSVSDNGIGIDERHTHRIFEIFQRLHGRDEYPGTGIGLAICKKVIKRHGGRIWVESEPGMGSTFYFTLPVTDAEDEIAHEGELEPSRDTVQVAA